MRLVFMGTPDFAVPCLEALIEAGHEIVAVYSQPDKPVGRKQLLEPTAVKKCAIRYNIPVYQPITLRNQEQLELMRSHSPQAVAVVAYGKLIPADMLKLAPLGFVNVHGSILPKYRGAAPIQWAVVNGEKETGVSTMLLGEGMDTGDVLEVATTKICDNETSGELFCRLSQMGAELLVSTLGKLSRGELAPTPQNDADATLAPIIRKEMALIDFDKSPNEICNAIRGFNPWPIAYTMYGSKRFKIYSAKAHIGKQIEKAQLKAEKGCLFFGCNGGAVEILEAQLEGGKRLLAAQLIGGRLVADGDKLGE